MQNDQDLFSNRLSNPEICKDISSSSASATSASFSRRADSNHVENAAQQRITQPKNDSNHNTQDIIPTVSNCITAKEVPKIANQNSSSSGAKAVQSSNLGMKISFKLYKKDLTFYKRIDHFSIFYKFIVHHLELFKPQCNASSKLPHILKPQFQAEAQRTEPPPNTFVPSNLEYQQQNKDKKPKCPLSQTVNTNQDGECAENIQSSPKIRQGFESTRDVQCQHRNKKYSKKRGCTNSSAEKIKRKKRRLECKRNQNSSYTSEIENVSLYTCMQCRKKVRSKGKLEHAVKHYQNLFLTDPINSSDNGHCNIDELICTRPGCGYNCKST